MTITNNTYVYHVAFSGGRKYGVKGIFFSFTYCNIFSLNLVHSNDSPINFVFNTHMFCFTIDLLFCLSLSSPNDALPTYLLNPSTQYRGCVFFLCVCIPTVFFPLVIHPHTFPMPSVCIVFPIPMNERI